PDTLTVTPSPPATDLVPSPVIQALVSDKGDFSLPKYFKFCADFHAMHARRDALADADERLLCDCDLQDTRFVIYTNKTVQRGRPPRQPPPAPLQQLVFPFEDIMDTGAPGDADNIFCLSGRDQAALDVFNGHSSENLYKTFFLPRLRIFCRQSHAEELDAIIYKEMNEMFGGPLGRIETYVPKYIQNFKDWSQEDHQDECITEASDRLEKIFEADIVNLARSAAGDDAFVFEPAFCTHIRDTLADHSAIRICVQGVPPGHRAAKLLQVLDENYADRWMYVGNTVNALFPTAALVAVCEKLCDVLVLDVEEVDDKILRLVKDVPGGVKIVALVSSRNDALKKKYDDILSSWKDLFDDWKLEHLQKNIQETFLDTELLFQMFPVDIENLSLTHRCGRRVGSCRCARWAEGGGAGRRQRDGALFLSALAAGGVAGRASPPPPDADESDGHRSAAHAAARERRGRRGGGCAALTSAPTTSRSPLPGATC
ncbi:Protein of unknown function, partial [Gryllus bimaculatus]